MYKVEIFKSNGETETFDNVETIEFGSQISNLRAVSNDDILATSFYPAWYYHFLGKDLSVNYHDKQTVEIKISKV